MYRPPYYAPNYATNGTQMNRPVMNPPKTQQQFWQELENLTEEMQSLGFSCYSVQQESRGVGQFSQELGFVTNQVNCHIDQLVQRHHMLLETVLCLRSSAEQHFSRPNMRSIKTQTDESLVTDVKQVEYPKKDLKTKFSQTEKCLEPVTVTPPTTQIFTEPQWEDDQSSTMTYAKTLQKNMHSTASSERFPPLSTVQQGSTFQSRINFAKNNQQSLVDTLNSSTSNIRKNKSVGNVKTKTVINPQVQENRENKSKKTSWLSQSAKKIEAKPVEMASQTAPSNRFVTLSTLNGDQDRVVLPKPETVKTEPITAWKTVTLLKKEPEVEKVVEAKKDLSSKNLPKSNSNSVPERSVQRKSEPARSEPRKVESTVTELKKEPESKKVVEAKKDVPSKILPKSDSTSIPNRNVQVKSEPARSVPLKAGSTVTVVKKEPESKKVVEAKKDVSSKDLPNVNSNSVPERIALVKSVPSRCEPTTAGNTVTTLKKEPEPKKVVEAKSVPERTILAKPESSKNGPKQAENTDKDSRKASEEKKVKQITGAEQDVFLENLSKSDSTSAQERLVSSKSELAENGPKKAEKDFKKEPVEKKQEQTTGAEKENLQKSDSTSAEERLVSSNSELARSELKPTDMELKKEPEQEQQVESEHERKDPKEHSVDVVPGDWESMIEEEEPVEKTVFDKAREELAVVSASEDTGSAPESSEPPTVTVEKKTKTQIKKERKMQQELEKLERREKIRLEKLEAERKRLAREAAKRENAVICVMNAIEYLKGLEEPNIASDFTTVKAKKFIEDRIQYYKKLKEADFVLYYTVLLENLCIQVLLILQKIHPFRNSATQCAEQEKMIFENLKSNSIDCVVNVEAENQRRRAELNEALAQNIPEAAPEADSEVVPPEDPSLENKDPEAVPPEDPSPEDNSSDPSNEKTPNEHEPEKDTKEEMRKRKAEKLKALKKKQAEEAEKRLIVRTACKNSIDFFESASDPRTVAGFTMVAAKRLIKERLHHCQRTKNLEMTYFYTYFQENLCTTSMNILQNVFVFRNNPARCANMEKVILEDMKHNSKLRAGAHDVKRCLDGLIPFYTSVQEDIRYKNAPIPEMLKAHENFMKLLSLWKSTDKKTCSFAKSKTSFLKLNSFHGRQRKSEHQYPAVMYVRLALRENQVFIDDGSIIGDMMAEGETEQEVDSFYYSIMRVVSDLHIQRTEEEEE